MKQPTERLLNVVLADLTIDAKEGTLLTEEHIRNKVARYAQLVTVDLEPAEKQLVVDELTTRFNVWTGSSRTLVGEAEGHEDWLPARKNETKWGFWDRYRQFQASTLAPAVLTELDRSTDEVLSQLEDPQRAGSWRRQGLVVGHVQSGKTAHYTGLICKASDAGYKVIVVLSGMHNSLRAQTQVRLDEGFLGYSQSFDPGNPKRVTVGVGFIDNRLRADSITTREENGDFRSQKAQGFHIHAGSNVLLFVVKKHAKVLEYLIEWARLSASKANSKGKKVVPDVPLLVVDDEADQASIDTNVQAFDEDGRPDLNHDPKTINRLIRQLLETFERRAYVGYTATPFANVFVHPYGRTEELGDDLFPKHFIVNLSAPSNYFGPSQIFGGDSQAMPAQGEVPSRIRFVTDSEEWSPPSHKSSHVPRFGGKGVLPPSLQEAIRAFILASAARRVRGDLSAHKSMLVHVTRFTAVQAQVHQQVAEYVNDLKARWRARGRTKGDTLLREMEQQWVNDFVATSERHGETSAGWIQVEPHVWPVLELLRVNLINAKASDALIYKEHEKTGLHVIAIGGDKLSRGLTLEGPESDGHRNTSHLSGFGGVHGPENDHAARLHLGAARAAMEVAPRGRVPPHDRAPARQAARLGA